MILDDAGPPETVAEHEAWVARQLEMAQRIEDGEPLPAFAPGDPMADES